MKTSILALILILSLSFTGVSQMPASDNFVVYHKQITMMEGLPSRHINSIHISKKGTIWYVVNNLLGKYYNERCFNTVISPRFSNRGFNQIEEDNKGNLWVSENKNWHERFNVRRLVYYCPAKSTLLPLPSVVPNPSQIFSFLADKSGILYLGYRNGTILTFNALTNQVKLLLKNNGYPVKLLSVTPSRLIYTLQISEYMDEALYQYNINTRQLNRRTFRNVSKVIQYSSTLDRDMMLYFSGNSNHIESLEGSELMDSNVYANSAFNHFSFLPNSPVGILTLQNQFSIVKQNFEKIGNFTTDGLIHDVAQDEYGNIFFSTSQGIEIYNLKPRLIRSYLKAKDINAVKFSCRAITPFNFSKVFVNTNQKRQFVDLSSGASRSLAAIKSTGNDFMVSSLRNAEGNFLFGEGHLVETQTSTFTDKISGYIPGNIIWSLYETPTHYLLGLEKSGIQKIDKKTHQITPFLINNQLFNDAIVYQILQIEGRLYFVSEIGMFTLIPSKVAGMMIARKVMNGYCYAISQDPYDPSVLLVATQAGLWRYSIKNNSATQIIHAPDIASKPFLAVYHTKTGYWAPSENGLYHFTNNGKLQKIYTETDGLSTIECNRNSHYADSLGRLFVGTVNGFNVINTHEVRYQRNEAVIRPDSVITFRNSGIARQTNLPEPGETFYIERGEDAVHLVFSLPDQDYFCDKKWEYVINPTSEVKRWMPMQGYTLVLAELPFGKNLIRVRAFNCGGQVQVKEFEFSVYQPYPFYLTWWFWLISVGILSFTVWGYFRNKSLALERKNLKLQSMVDAQTLVLRTDLELKDKLISMLVHDVRYPIQSFYDYSKKISYLLKRGENERLILLGKETETKSKKILWLVDELVYWVKSTSNKTDIPLSEQDVVRVVEAVLESYDEEIKQKELTFDIQPETLLLKIDYGLTLIMLRNLLFNAIIHSAPATEVKIRMEFNRNTKAGKLVITNQMLPPDQRPRVESLGIGLKILESILNKKGASIFTEKTDNEYITTLQLDPDNAYIKV